jgi:hypothetical protein
MSKFTDFCGGKVAVDELVTALHKTAATECVCRTWFCEAFDIFAVIQWQLLRKVMGFGLGFGQVCVMTPARALCLSDI